MTMAARPSPANFDSGPDWMFRDAVTCGTRALSMLNNQMARVGNQTNVTVRP